MLIFSGVFRSPIVITSTVTIVPYFSNDTKGSFDETSAAFSSPGVPVVYLAWTDVIESGVMDVSQVNNNLVSCLLFLFARFCVRWSGSHVDF